MWSAAIKLIYFSFQVFVGLLAVTALSCVQGNNKYLIKLNAIQLSSDVSTFQQ